MAKFSDESAARCRPEHFRLIDCDDPRVDGRPGHFGPVDGIDPTILARSMSDPVKDDSCHPTLVLKYIVFFLFLIVFCYILFEAILGRLVGAQWTRNGRMP